LIPDLLHRCFSIEELAEMAFFAVLIVFLIEKDKTSFVELFEEVFPGDWLQRWIARTSWHIDSEQSGFFSFPLAIRDGRRLTTSGRNPPSYFVVVTCVFALV